ncbi:short-chain dehydrogenase/oxidoreductase [Levilactobacillus brevis]|nr:short-chain dehydrogenase/oxidoreductase [Levilactobacillus brevis]
MKLEQQRVLIVGGTSGFGKAVAQQALQAGAQVHIIGH